MISPIGKRGPNSRPPGYTLVELVLLVLIIAVLIGISTPQFKNAFLNLELKEAAFNISRLITFSQEKAIVEGAMYKIIFDADGKRYYLLKPDPEKTGRYVRLKERYGRIFSLPKGVIFKTDKRELFFYPDGRSDEAVIILQGKRKKIKLTVERAMGHVKVEENI